MKSAAEVEGSLEASTPAARMLAGDVGGGFGETRMYRAGESAERVAWKFRANRRSGRRFAPGRRGQTGRLSTISARSGRRSIRECGAFPGVAKRWAELPLGRRKDRTRFRGDSPEPEANHASPRIGNIRSKPSRKFPRGRAVPAATAFALTEAPDGPESRAERREGQSAQARATKTSDAIADIVRRPPRRRARSARKRRTAAWRLIAPGRSAREGRESEDTGILQRLPLNPFTRLRTDRRPPPPNRLVGQFPRSATKPPSRESCRQCGSRSPRARPDRHLGFRASKTPSGNGMLSFIRAKSVYHVWSRNFFAIRRGMSCETPRRPT